MYGQALRGESQYSSFNCIYLVACDIISGLLILILHNVQVASKRKQIRSAMLSVDTVSMRIIKGEKF